MGEAKRTPRRFSPFPRKFFLKARYFSLCAKNFFVTNFVTHITNFVIHVTKFVTHVRNFVTNFFCADSKKYQAERENYLPDNKKRAAQNFDCPGPKSIFGFYLPPFFSIS